jgi:hypothetical protein
MLNSRLYAYRGLLPICVAVLLLANACSSSEPRVEQVVSVHEVMVSIVTPATDVIWGVEDPQSDEEWAVIENAANTVIVAAAQIKQGGAGPNDAQWASEVAWQAFADRVLNAGIAARDAARNKDLDAVLQAGKVLYPPCEECHLRFHPGFQQAE